MKRLIGNYPQSDCEAAAAAGSPSRPGGKGRARGRRACALRSWRRRGGCAGAEAALPQSRRRCLGASASRSGSASLRAGCGLGHGHGARQDGPGQPVTGEGCRPRSTCSPRWVDTSSPPRFSSSARGCSTGPSGSAFAAGTSRTAAVSEGVRGWRGGDAGASLLSAAPEGRSPPGARGSAARGRCSLTTPGRCSGPRAREAREGLRGVRALQRGSLSTFLPQPNFRCHLLTSASVQRGINLRSPAAPVENQLFFPNFFPFFSYGA